jgi:hypothetical protein
MDERINLHLVETRTFGSGVVFVRYQRETQNEVSLTAGS